MLIYIVVANLYCCVVNLYCCCGLNLYCCVAQIDSDEIQLAERIGKGTYGEVYKGVWRGTVVAVKKLPGHNITPNLLADFLREVRLMKQMRHPNVLQFLGACLTDNHRDLAILMEFMPRN